jgi:PadR family transcriptional regulator, regulatory protein PadR
MTNLEYHALLALAKGPLYGYAIKEAIETESGGTLTPRAGSMYRMLARLMTNGLVKETRAPRGAEPHPGLARRYYGLTPQGKTGLAAEARRLKGAAKLAEERLRILEGRS